MYLQIFFIQKRIRNKVRISAQIRFSTLEKPMISRKYTFPCLLALPVAAALIILAPAVNAQHLRVKSVKELYNPDTVAIGKMAPDIIAQEPAGLTAQLSFFRGKYVLIQVWSSAMNSCTKEMDAWKKMKEVNRNRNVTFLDLSVDKDLAAWQLYYAQHNLQGVELHADAMKPPLCYYVMQLKSKEGHNYFSYTLPQYILIDPKGVILDSHINIKPSDKSSFAHFLDRLPGI